MMSKWREHLEAMGLMPVPIQETGFEHAIQTAQDDGELEEVLDDIGAAYGSGELDRATVESLARLMGERGRQLYQQEQQRPETGRERRLSDLFREDPIHRVESRALGEEVLFAADDADVPGENDLVVYREEELRLLAGRSSGELKKIHRVKKAFGGEVVDYEKLYRDCQAVRADSLLAER